MSILGLNPTMDMSEFDWEKKLLSEYVDMYSPRTRSRTLNCTITMFGTVMEKIVSVMRSYK